MRGRVLVIDYKVPTPDKDSGSASTFSYLQILARAGYDVIFCPYTLPHPPRFKRALKHFGIKYSGRYTRALERLGIKTLSAPEWTSIDAVIEAFAPRSDVVLLYRAPFASQIFDLVKRVAPAAKILFHPVDLHFLRIEREAALSGDHAQAKSASAMRMIELDLISKADATIVVSEYEIRLLRELLPQATIHQIPILREIPLSCARTNYEKRRDILFIGGFRHAPNVDAVLWFVREVWPGIQKRGFSDRFIIVGSDVPQEIFGLADQKIDVRGYVRDLAPLFAACRLSVAPLRYGGGIKGKVVTSLSYSLPVVATSVAVEGMGLRDANTVLVADTPNELAENIVRLYNDGELWQRLSSNSYQTFLDKFCLTAGSDRLITVVDGLIRSPPRRQPPQHFEATNIEQCTT
jgi:O-antigen biosynthesis protein